MSIYVVKYLLSIAITFCLNILSYKQLKNYHKMKGEKRSNLPIASIKMRNKLKAQMLRENKTTRLFLKTIITLCIKSMVTRAFLFVHRSLLLFYFNHDYRKNTWAHWLSITLANFVYIVDSSLIFFILFYCNRIFKRNLLKLIKVIKTFLEDKLVCM